MTRTISQQTDDTATFTLVQSGQSAIVAARLQQGRVWIGAEGIRAALGWDLRPEGLCRHDECLPTGDLDREDGLEISDLAKLLGRPVAISLDERAAYLGPERARFDETVGALQAPDFSLPDLEGTLHSLSQYRGSKVLLAAWASW